MDLDHADPSSSQPPVRPRLRDRLRDRGIGLVRRFIKTPDISITDLKLRQMSLMEQRGALSIRLHNPNRIALGVRAFR
ncbi:MAG TPA: hypothetical protein DDW89_08915, partial [Gammaproteobacteria bacterium]|nr:hypothetical protein [Gammaproteobacteria bacterium]